MTSGCGRAATERRQPTVIRAAYSSAVDIGDLPSLVAHRLLERAGYRVDVTFYAQPELAVEALASGGADVASGGTRAFWAATAKGAGLRLVMQHARNGYQLAAVSGVATCRDLHGRTLALSSQGSLPTALGQAFLQRCPDARPRIVTVPHSGDRMQALLNGAIEATVLQRSDVARLQARAAGRFTTVDEFDTTVPALDFTGVFVRRAFADAHPDVVLDYVRERIRANRLVLATPALLVEEAGRWPSIASLDAAVVEGEVQAPAWARDGGISPASVAATLQFFAGTRSLPASLTTGDAADFSFADAAVTALSDEDGTP